ncbi:MAG: DUF4249 family protein [Bacteroidales bacterium]
MKRELLCFCLLLLLHIGCVETVDLVEQYYYPQKLVIEGEISNDSPPYYFRLFKSGALNASYFEGVENALLILSDNTGKKDTLQPLEKDIYLSRNYETCSYYYIDDRGDSIYICSKSKKISDPKSIFDGYFASHHIRGIPGNTYTLEIIYDEHRYIATEKMQSIPEVTNFEIRYVSHEKEGWQLTPFIDFINPSHENNYYIFSFKRSSLEEIMDMVNIKNWSYSITDGQNLPLNVRNFQVNSGETSKGYPTNMWYPFNETDSATIRVGSISESYFNFVSGQIDQLRADGGAYMPSPTSLKGNFGNEILGYFRVISVCEKKTLYDKKDNP